MRYPNRRRFNTQKRKDDIAKTILQHPEKTYDMIADEYCISTQTVKRIAVEYGIGRSARPY